MSQSSGNVALFSGDVDFQAVQTLRESGSSSRGNDTVQSELPKIKKQCPRIEAFTVQCNRCRKWRVIPSLQKYEEIREKLQENKFYCETAREWEPGMTCLDPENISQFGTSIWALDKPSISRPPAGWKRLLQIRNEGCTRFADVYYVAPSGKKLRSSVEVQKYLNDHPQYIREGVNLSQFSFQIPIPLQKDYVRKRPARPSKRIRTTDLSTSDPCDDLASQD